MVKRARSKSRRRASKKKKSRCAKIRRNRSRKRRGSSALPCVRRGAKKSLCHGGSHWRKGYTIRRGPNKGSVVRGCYIRASKKKRRRKKSRALVKA